MPVATPTSTTAPPTTRAHIPRPRRDAAGRGERVWGMTGSPNARAGGSWTFRPVNC